MSNPHKFFNIIQQIVVQSVIIIYLIIKYFNKVSIVGKKEYSKLEVELKMKERKNGCNVHYSNNSIKINLKTS